MRLPPIFEIMARLAFFTELFFMHVILFVATVTLTLEFFLVDFSVVASRTFHLFVLIFERIFGVLGVVKFIGFPVLFLMTGFAFFAKIFLMLIVNLVTPDTRQGNFFLGIWDVA